MDSSDVGHVGSLPPVLTFVLEEGFESALKTLRRALAEDQLCVTAELDAAKRVRRALNIVVSPCRILLVENPLLMLEATAIDRSSAVLIPMHVVVSSGGARTLIHVLSTQHAQLHDFPVGARIPLARIHHQVLAVLTKVADRAFRDGLVDRGSEPVKQPDI